MIVPLPYQLEDIARIEQFDGRTLNANSMGLGKTLETLWVLQRNPSWLPALVIAPAGVKIDWQVAASSLGFSVALCQGQKPPKTHDNDFSLASPITIINYDILQHWVEYIGRLRPRTIVMDECRNITNVRTRRYRAAAAIIAKAERVMGLDGTPLSNRVSELFPIVNLIWPDAFATFSEFSQMFCKPYWTPWGWKTDKSENEDILHEKLKRLGMVRRRKEDVLKDLPEKIRRVVPCEISDPDEYNRASTDFIGWLKERMAHRVRAASRAEALTRVSYLLRLASRLKIRTPVDWANRFLQQTDEKLILFAIHEKAGDVLKRRVEAKSVEFNGKMTPHQKHAAVNVFRDDPDTRVLIGSRAAWAGINLQVASTTGMVEMHWNPAHVNQAEDRTWRLGQRNAVWINYFVAQGTIEERLCKILQQKQTVASAVLDGGPRDNDLNIFDLYLDEIQQEL